MSYCAFVNALPADTLDPNKHYHDHQYGFPLVDDSALFGRLLLEINQAGLSWTLMLKKQAAFHAAYSGFNIAAIAAYGDADRDRLLADAGIVRNRRKIDAAIYNAQQVQRLQAGTRLVQSLAGCPAPARFGGMGQAVQATLQIRGRRNCGRIFNELRLPARRTHARLPRLRPRAGGTTRMAARQSLISLILVCRTLPLSVSLFVERFAP